jgi:hypothetical protein
MRTVEININDKEYSKIILFGLQDFEKTKNLLTILTLKKQ